MCVSLFLTCSSFPWENWELLLCLSGLVCGGELLLFKKKSYLIEVLNEVLTELCLFMNGP